MKDMKINRRQILKGAGALGVTGSAAAFIAGSGYGDLAKTPGAPRRTEQKGEKHDHDPRPVRGPLASATVSFGHWRTDVPVPLDRYPYPPPPIPPPPPGNGHKVIPHEVTIKVGGTVSYIIAGLHQIVVYAPGKSPEEVNTTLTRPTQGVPSGVLLINDPVDRLYAGPDPSTIHGGPPQSTTPLLDRVEVVQFSRQGLHLVICGVFNHFVNDDMFGWVKVVGDEEADE